MTYYKSHLVAASKTKQISLPFNGLYHSYLGELLYDELDTATDAHCLDTGTAVFDYVYSLDLKKYHKALTDSYALHLIDTLNEHHGLAIEISDIDYVPMNGQNSGDELLACVNVNTLPVIPLESLQPYAKRALTSHSGFTSFYDPDLQALEGARLENWQDIYITFIIEYLDNDLNNNEWDNVEQAYIDELRCTGGAIELLMNNITDEQCEQLNNLLYKD